MFTSLLSFSLAVLGVSNAFPLSIRADQPPPSVVAHFMAQNSFSYTPDDWKKDIDAAQAIGIDAFALNIALDDNGQLDYEVPKTADAFKVAEANGNFKLFYSFDMTRPWTTSQIVEVVSAHAQSPAAYRWKGDLLVSTFSGEDRLDPFWKEVKDTLAGKGIKISLAPSFLGFRAPSRANELLDKFPSIDGFLNWWSWPEDVPQDLTTETDLAYKSAIKTRSGPFMMAVSPWQYKNIKNLDQWVEQSDTLWKYRWEQAINEVKPDIIEIVTWNDYGESHYISDINTNVFLGDDAPNYVNGMDHAGWRLIAQYYIEFFKTGKAPVVKEDKVVVWYRVHPKAATCAAGGVPRNKDFPEDAIFAFALLASPAQIKLNIGSKEAQFDGPAGVSLGKVAFPTEDEQIPFIQIIRNQVTVKSGFGSHPITNKCDFFNFNPFVGVIG